MSMKILLTIIVLTCFLGKADSLGGQDQDQRKDPPVAFKDGSPKEVFQTFVAAAKKRDWDTWHQCLTPELELYLCGGVVQFRKGPNLKNLNVNQPNPDPATQWMIDYLKFLKKYDVGLGVHDREVRRKFVTNIDRTKFIKDFAKLMTGRNVPKQISENFWLFSGKAKLINDIKIDGEKAKGSAKFGNRKISINFRDSGDGWRLDR